MIWLVAAGLLIAILGAVIPGFFWILIPYNAALLATVPALAAWLMVLAAAALPERPWVRIGFWLVEVAGWSAAAIIAGARGMQPPGRCARDRGQR